MTVVRASAITVLVLLVAYACFMNGLNDRLFGPPIKTVVGTLTRVERNDDYEAPCRILQAILTHGCPDTPRGYDGWITDSLGRRTWFVMFALKGDTLPTLGLTARWTLHRDQIGVWRKGPSTGEVLLLLTLESEHDVRPL